MPILGSPQNSCFYSSQLPKGVPLPAGTILPIWSGYTENSDWDQVFTTTNAAIVGTTGIAGPVGSVPVNTITAGTDATYACTLSTTGAHTGTIVQGRATATAGSARHRNLSNTSVGNHSHSVTTRSISGLRPSRAHVGLIRANKPVYDIPPNTIVFRDKALGSYGSDFNPTLLSGPTLVHMSVASTTAVAPNNRFTTLVAVSSFAPGYTTSTSGIHLHTAQNATSTTGTTGELDRQAIGDHTHTVSINATQQWAGPNRVLHAWISSASRQLLTGTMVMYNGSLDALPPGWFLCDGNNGTLNMNGYYLVYTRSPNAAPAFGSIFQGTISGTDSVPSYGVSHTHERTDNLRSSANQNANHKAFTWTHSHTITSRTFTPYQLTRLSLYFIQYKE